MPVLLAKKMSIAPEKAYFASSEAMISLRTRSSIHLQHNIMFFSQTAHTQQRIAHTAKSCIDAHTCNLGNFLKTKVLIVTHVYHLALIVRESIHKSAHINKRLIIDHLRLDIIIAQVYIIQQINLGIIIRNRILIAILTERVNHQVMSNTHNPCTKTAVTRIATLLYGHDGFHEGLLKDIFGQFLVTYSEKDIIVEFALIASQQLIERFIITFLIAYHQHVVSEHIQVLHYYLLLVFVLSKSVPIGNAF